MTPQFVSGLVDVLQRIVDGPRISGRIEALEMRVALLEPKPRASLKGAWTAGRAYHAGDAVTHLGRLWLCNVATDAEPMRDFNAWRLAPRHTLDA
jgi:hypothetical protein